MGFARLGRAPLPGAGSPSWAVRRASRRAAGRFLPPRVWALWLRVSVPAEGALTRFYAAAGSSGSAPRLRAAFSPGGAGPVRSGALNLAHALARVLPVPCTRPAPPHGAHTYVRGPRGLELTARSWQLPSGGAPPPSLRGSPGSAPLRAKQSRLRNSPPGRPAFLAAPTPHPAAHAACPPGGPGLPATTHPALPSWLSVARRGPPFFGSSSVCIIIRGGQGPA